MTAARFLAIDGGSSKTDVVIGTAGGTVLAFLRGPGTSAHLRGLPTAMGVLGRLVAGARTVAGLPADEPLDRAAVYLAGADLPIEVDRLREAVAAAGWATSSTVDNDVFALLRAGTAEPDAVAVVCGAGINCVGRRADGRTARFPALGSVSGDWGGGGHLAQLALWHAARGEDGRGPATALTRAVADHFGLSTVADVGAGLHLGELPAARLWELSPVLFAVAEAGDPVAAALVAQQAEEVVALVRVVGGQLDLLDAPHTVVLGGGVLRARHRLLHEPVVAGLRARARYATIRIVTDPPVVGAALLALDGLVPGTDRERYEARLRAALGRPPIPTGLAAPTPPSATVLP
jgi:N-acetylglucosamine kinase-like BadF-type ATPase